MVYCFSSQSDGQDIGTSLLILPFYWPVFTTISHYFIAWPNTPATKANYYSHYPANMLQDLDNRGAYTMSDLTKQKC